MVEAQSQEDPFTRVIDKLSNSAEEARKSKDKTPQELQTSLQDYNEWAISAINLILKEVTDPLSKVKAFGDILK